MIVLVTGGTRGIGRALAIALIERGVHVAVCARTAATLPGAFQVIADVSRPEEARRCVAEVIARFGKIDALVNNAALADGDIGDVLATNVGGADACSRAVLAHNPGARLVKVSSGIVNAAQPDASGYAASKHALEGLTRGMARDFLDATIIAVQLGATTPDAAVPALLDALSVQGMHGRVIQTWRTERPLDLHAANDLAHPLGPSPAAREAMATYARDGAFARYPTEGALPKLLAAEHGVSLDSIVLGAGASDLLDRILCVLVGRGERIVAHAPSWPLFPRLCDARGVVPTTVPYRLRNGTVDHDLEAVAAATDRTVRAVYLISPSNPMGCAIDEEPFARFLAALPSETLVVVDEAYGEFVTRESAARAIAWTRRDPRVIAVRTFSKFYALAGMRIGYAIASPPTARRLVDTCMPFAISEVAQLAAAAALADRGHTATTHALLARGRAELATALPSDAPFALIERQDLRGSHFGGRYEMVSLWPTDATDPTNSK